MFFICEKLGKYSQKTFRNFVYFVPIRPFLLNIEWSANQKNLVPIRPVPIRPPPVYITSTVSLSKFSNCPVRRTPEKQNCPVRREFGKIVLLDGRPPGRTPV